MHSSLKSIFQGDQDGFSGLAANYKSLKKIITEKSTKKIRMCVFIWMTLFHAFKQILKILFEVLPSLYMKSRFKKE